MIRYGVDMIAVEWLDSTNHGRDYFDTEDPSAPERFKPITLIDTGFLVYENENQITFASEWQPKYKRFQDCSTIPKINIIRQTRWKLRMAKDSLVRAVG